MFIKYICYTLAVLHVSYMCITGVLLYTCITGVGITCIIYQNNTHVLHMWHISWCTPPHYQGRCNSDLVD